MAVPDEEPAFETQNALIDDECINETENVWRTLHHAQKHDENPLLEADKPWEGYLVLQPGTVIYDEEASCFRMWYNTQPSSDKPDVGKYLCYATSPDGISWEKPPLDQFEFEGKSSTNILLDGVHWNHVVLKEPDAVNADRRYKLLYWGEGGVNAAFSADGIEWHVSDENPVVPRAVTGDTFSVMRDPQSGEYWLYHKTPNEPIRTVSRMVSDDFLSWHDSRRVLGPDKYDTPDIQFYGLSAFPYRGQYAGLLWVYHTYSQDMDIQLVSSRDGVSWNRVADRKLLMHLVPTNRYEGESFDSRMVYPASAPIVRDDKLWTYYSGFSVPHNAMAVDHDGKIGVAQHRLDGFISMDTTSEGHLLTEPVTVEGSELAINAAVRDVPDQFAGADSADTASEPSGSIRVEIQYVDGTPVPGFELDACESFTGDSTDAVISWQGAQSLEALVGRTVQIKFVMCHAQLFGWTIQ